MLGGGQRHAHTLSGEGEMRPLAGWREVELVVGGCVGMPYEGFKTGVLPESIAWPWRLRRGDAPSAERLGLQAVVQLQIAPWGPTHLRRHADVAQRRSGGESVE